MRLPDLKRISYSLTSYYKKLKIKLINYILINFGKTLPPYSLSEEHNNAMPRTHRFKKGNITKNSICSNQKSRKNLFRKCLCIFYLPTIQMNSFATNYVQKNHRAKTKLKIIFRKPIKLTSETTKIAATKLAFVFVLIYILANCSAYSEQRQGFN